jgi:acetyltransferase-like isoleucine patch superfamily enzyme
MENIFFDLKNLKACGENVIIGKTVRIRNPELVEIGDYVIIDDFTYISGNVSIGDYVHIAANSTLQASSGKISIGNHCGISSGCRLFAASSDYQNPNYDMPCYPNEIRQGGIISEIIISSYCLIGANAVVLPGVTIPEGVAFGAGLIISGMDYQPWRLYFEKTLSKSVSRSKDALTKIF